MLQTSPGEQDIPFMMTISDGNRPKTGVLEMNFSCRILFDFVLCCLLLCYLFRNIYFFDFNNILKVMRT